MHLSYPARRSDSPGQTNVVPCNKQVDRLQIIQWLDLFCWPYIILLTFVYFKGQLPISVVTSPRGETDDGLYQIAVMTRQLNQGQKPYIGNEGRGINLYVLK